MSASDKVATVGVVIRTKDRPVFVLRALRSVADQMFQDWRIALVNDGGNTIALDAALADTELSGCLAERIIRLDLSPGVGRSAAFNRGVQALETEFVTCLDDDDTWAPEFLSALVSFYRETSSNVPDLGGVLSQAKALCEEVQETPEGQRVSIIGEDDLPAAFKRPEFFINPLAYACYRQDFYPVQWLLRRDAVLAVGGFPENFDVMEDRAFMNRFLARNRLAVLERPLAYHHRRVSRSKDKERSIHLNTLDNPSYDWRFFADLARPGFDLEARAQEAEVLFSVSSALLAEMNYETSAIWQKVNGEARALEARLDSLKTEIIASVAPEAEPAEIPALPASEDRSPSVSTEPQMRDLAIPYEKRAYDLWRLFPAQDHAQHVVPGVRFAKRLELSHNGSQQGLLLHISPSKQQLELQIPDTGDWSAFELALDDLILPGCGLRCHVVLSSIEGYLFETALAYLAPSSAESSRHMLEDFKVHACHAQQCSVLSRTIDAAWLERVKNPKLSIVLPRNARNFRFVCNNIVVEHIPKV